VGVTGLAIGMAVEPILWFFENPRRSGGGPVLELYHDEQQASAVITFHERQGEFLFVFFQLIVLWDLIFNMSSAAVTLELLVPLPRAFGQISVFSEAFELVDGYTTGSLVYCQTSQLFFSTKEHCHYCPVLIFHPAGLGV